MATARITFDLNDSEDLRLYSQFNNASKTESVLFEITHNLRKQAKWFLAANPKSDPLDFIFNEINKLCENEGLNINDLG